MQQQLTGVLFALALLSSAGCEVEEIVQEESPTARLTTAPLMLEFGPVSPGQSLTQVITLGNTGNAELAIADLFLEGSASFTLEEAGIDRLLSPGEQTLVPVTFAPTAFENATAVLHVRPGDPEIAASEVSLQGDGMAAAIELDPVEFAFGDVGVGCEQAVAISITNVGWGPLELADVYFTPTSDELEFAYDFGPGALLNPGESEHVTIYYTPRDEVADAGYLYVHSDDPAQPEAVAIQTGTAHLCEEVEETFEQVGTYGADILWAVDNSCSMGEERTALTVRFASLQDMLEVHGVDYQIGVISTGSSELLGDTPVMTPATPDIHLAFADAIEELGTTSGTTTGLSTACDAVSSPNTDPGGPNDGFLREDALLHVIFVARAADESLDAVQSYVQCIEAGGDATIHGALELPSARYEQAVTLTGGTLMDLASEDWMDGLSAIAWLMAPYSNTFELAGDPVQDTISVAVDGVAIHDGWDYDIALNAVVFHPDEVPDPGETITVRYSPVADCDGC